MAAPYFVLFLILKIGLILALVNFCPHAPNELYDSHNFAANWFRRQRVAVTAALAAERPCKRLASGIPELFG
jgi:hypothetical protein